jgi:Smr domain
MRILSDQERQLWLAYVHSPPRFTSSIRGLRPSSMSMTLDLHGMTLQEAHARLCEFVYEHQQAGTHHVCVITGKSGVLLHELPRWCSSLHTVKSCEPTSVGSYQLALK